jgi:adenosylhomocysteine nucleosidase
MRFERATAAAAATPAISTIAIVVALGLEQASLRRSARGAPRQSISIYRSGPGEARAAAAAKAALANGARALVSWGMAGALAATIQPGTLILPRDVRSQDGRRFEANPVWHARLAAELASGFTVEQRSLLGAAEVLATPQVKEQAARSSGAVAADMESCGIARIAAHAAVPFVALRVIVDAQADRLPPRPERWIDEHGDRRFTAALAAAFAPAQWPSLWLLAQRYRVARGVLDSLAERLLRVDFLLPADSTPGS